MLAPILCALTALWGASGADTLVVCPAEFRGALAPWIVLRQGQGHRVETVSNMLSADELRLEIRRRAANGLKYVVLVGDAEPDLPGRPSLRARCVATHYVPATVNVRFGSEPHIATDNRYADIDDDGVPDLAVGRLTADSPQELAVLVRKILDYENCRDFGPWRRQVNFVAGVGGWGALADAILEAAAKTLISEGLPPSIASSMTYASWQSAYCPDPRRFHETTLERLNEGSLFWVYIGHGQLRELDRLRLGNAAYPILTADDATRLNCRHGASVACFLACYSGAFDQPRDCLGEELLRAPGGPVAVLAGTRVTLPYGLAVLGSELLREAFAERAATVGDALLQAKRRTVQPSQGVHRLALDSIARAFYPGGSSLEDERLEHLDLFTLLGDPLLKIDHPKQIEVRCDKVAKPGSRLAIAVRSPIEGQAVVELTVRRDRLTFPAPHRNSIENSSLTSFQEVYRQANDGRLAAAHRPHAEQAFDVELSIPPEATGPCYVRVFVEGAGSCAVGAAEVLVEAEAQ